MAEYQGPMMYLPSTPITALRKVARDVSAELRQGIYMFRGQYTSQQYCMSWHWMGHKSACQIRTLTFY